MRELESHEPDALLVASFGRIIPAPLLDLTPWPLNVHPSLLPRLRGPSPIRTALLEGLSETGCCIMRMTPRLDDGDVLYREVVPIEPHWNYEQLETQLGSLGGTLAGEAFDAIEAGSAVFTPQNHDEATYCQMHGREDAHIDWSRPASELDSFVRAWDPDIGAWTTASSGKRLKVWSVSVEEPTVELRRDAHPGPGRVLAVATRALWVSTGRGVLRIREVQPENRSRMPAASYLAGNRLAAGDVFGV
jgi:methionyl-tRNA formyltransferase